MYFHWSRRTAGTPRIEALDQQLPRVGHGFVENQEVGIEDPAEIVGKTIHESAIRKRTGTTILAIKKGDGRILTNPEVSTILDPTDRLILVGTAEQLENFKKAFSVCLEAKQYLVKF